MSLAWKASLEEGQSVRVWGGGGGLVGMHYVEGNKFDAIIFEDSNRETKYAVSCL